MKREEKAAVIEQVSEQLASADTVYAVDYRGITVPQIAELRGKLREADASFHIVKNRLAKLAVEQADAEGIEGLAEWLEGPTALAFVRGDAVIAAKAIADFFSEHEVPEYKGGLMEGEGLDADSFGRIARLPGLEVLRGQLVGVAASPITGLARGLSQMISGLASQLGQIAEQGLVGGGEEPPVEAVEAEAKEPEAEEKAPEPEAEEASAEGSADEAEAAAEDKPDEDNETDETGDGEDEEPAAAEESADDENQEEA